MLAAPAHRGCSLLSRRGRAPFRRAIALYRDLVKKARLFRRRVLARPLEDEERGQSACVELVLGLPEQPADEQLARLARVLG